MELLDKNELALFLNVDIKTVKYLLYSKQLPKVRIGKTYRFLKSEIEQWVEEKSEKPRQFDLENFLQKR
jgi:excisionase family DNA binding protein